MPDDVIHTLGHGFDWCAKELHWPVTTDVGGGLAGVIATTTRVMWLDPSSGRLAYRGVPIELLAQRPDFEKTAYLLITGLPAEQDPTAYSAFRSNLRSSRRLPDEAHALVAEFPATVHPMRVLRAAISAVGCHEMDASDDIDGGRHWRELRVVGQVVSLVGHIAAHRRGEVLPTPDPETSLADATLRALTGRTPTARESEALNLLWVLYAAHGLDAPTFTSMIVASCLADPYSNITAGLSALTGHRQGGAGERIVEVLTQLEDPQSAARWVETSLERGETIPGFGHRAYRMADPRVTLLRKAAATLAHSSSRGPIYDVARSIEEAATRALAPRGAFVNLNLYGALIFHLLGAHAAEVPSLIAAARISGMVALVRETLHDIRLFRPLTRYVGRPTRHLTDRGSP